MPLNLRNRLRAYLGTDLPHLESRMTTMLELLTGLTNQTAEASAAQQASFLNLHNALTRQGEAIARLEQLVRDGEVSPEVQELAATLSTGLADIKKAAETADNGFEPIEEPAPPVDPGTEVPADPEVPVDETPTVPVEGEPVANESTRRRR